MQKAKWSRHKQIISFGIETKRFPLHQFTPSAIVTLAYVRYGRWNVFQMTKCLKQFRREEIDLRLALVRVHFSNDTIDEMKHQIAFMMTTMTMTTTTTTTLFTLFVAFPFVFHCRRSTRVIHSFIHPEVVDHFIYGRTAEVEYHPKIWKLSSALGTRHAINTNKSRSTKKKKKTTTINHNKRRQIDICQRQQNRDRNGV